MTAALFDATPYGPDPKARTTATPPEPVTTIAVAGERWNGTSKTTPGITHYVVGPKVDPKRGTIAGAVSACGLVVVPHTYDPGEQLPGCAVCAARVKSG